LEHPERHGAYVYLRTVGGVWTQQAKLTSASRRGYTYVAVAIDKNTAVLGYSGCGNPCVVGEADIFVRRTGIWFLWEN
jgi:hypothetical protein